MSVNYDHVPVAVVPDQQGGVSATTDMAHGLICRQVTTLTNAQVLALHGTPITVVSAPGAGRIIEFVSACLILNYGGTGYTESADNLVFKYVNGSGSSCSATVEMTGFIDQTADAITFAHPIATEPNITAAGELSNAVVVLYNANDEFGGGHASSTLTVIVNYRTHATGL